MLFERSAFHQVLFRSRKIFQFSLAAACLATGIGFVFAGVSDSNNLDILGGSFIWLMAHVLTVPFVLSWFGLEDTLAGKVFKKTEAPFEKLGMFLAMRRKTFLLNVWAPDGLVCVTPSGWRLRVDSTGADPILIFSKQNLDLFKFRLREGILSGFPTSHLLIDRPKGLFMDDLLFAELTNVVPAELAALIPADSNSAAEPQNNAHEESVVLALPNPLGPYLVPIFAALKEIAPHAPDSAQAALASFQDTCLRLQAMAASLSANAPALAVFQDSVLPRIAQLLAGAKPFLTTPTDGAVLAPLVKSLDAWAAYSATATSTLQHERLNGLVATANTQLAAAVLVDPLVAPVPA